MAEQMNLTYYEQLASAPGARTSQKPDKRDKLDDSICTKCGVRTTPTLFESCRYGKVAVSGDGNCNYLRFGFMCDKLVASNGEEIN
jgi:hypothetical protein